MIVIPWLTLLLFGIFFLFMAQLASIVVYHLQRRQMADLALRMAHSEASLDMLLDSQRELQKLIVVYMENV